MYAVDFAPRRSRWMQRQRPVF